MPSSGREMEFSNKGMVGNLVKAVTKVWDGRNQRIVDCRVIIKAIIFPLSHYNWGGKNPSDKYQNPHYREENATMW